jgi:hypothetical protein
MFAPPSKLVAILLVNRLLDGISYHGTAALDTGGRAGPMVGPANLTVALVLGVVIYWLVNS